MGLKAGKRPDDEPRLQPAVEWSVAIDRFRANMIEFEKSDLTIANYVEDLVRFQSWHKSMYGEEPGTSWLGAWELREWKTSMVDRKLMPQTINRRLVAIKSFLR